MKLCPRCSGEIQPTAVKCKHCGAMLGDPPTRPAIQYSHSGDRYLLGYDAEGFGIWDRAFPLSPVRLYPRTDDGWKRAWEDFTTWEPVHADVGLGSAGSAIPTTGDIGTGAAERINPWWWALPILIGWIGGLIAWLALRERDRRVARNMLLLGLVLSAVTVTIELMRLGAGGRL